MNCRILVPSIERSAAETCATVQRIPRCGSSASAAWACVHPRSWRARQRLWPTNWVRGETPELCRRPVRHRGCPAAGPKQGVGPGQGPSRFRPAGTGGCPGPPGRRRASPGRGAGASLGAERASTKERDVAIATGLDLTEPVVQALGPLPEARGGQRVSCGLASDIEGIGTGASGETRTTTPAATACSLGGTTRALPTTGLTT